MIVSEETYSSTVPETGAEAIRGRPDTNVTGAVPTYRTANRIAEQIVRTDRSPADTTMIPNLTESQSQPTPRAWLSARSRSHNGATQVTRWRQALDGLTMISMDPDVLHGTPAIRGTRISVSQVLDLLAELRSVDKVCAQFPDGLDVRAVEEALMFAARLAR